MYVILSGILDGSKFHEFKVLYGPEAITGQGCIEGRRIGVVANCGNIGYKEALKISHFVNSCNRRRVPIMFLQNCVIEEKTGTQDYSESTEDNENEMSLLKCRASLASQIATVDVPKIALTISGLSQEGCLTMVY